MIKGIEISQWPSHIKTEIRLYGGFNHIVAIFICLAAVKIVTPTYFYSIKRVAFYCRNA